MKGNSFHETSCSVSLPVMLPAFFVSRLFFYKMPKNQSSRFEFFFTHNSVVIAAGEPCEEESCSGFGARTSSYKTTS